MQIILTQWEKNWEEDEPQTIAPVILDLRDENVIFSLSVSFGNGIFDTICVEVYDGEAYKCIHGMFVLIGNAKNIEHNKSLKSSILYREGYEAFCQEPDAFFFLNPEPRPELFSNSALKKYAKEFRLEEF